MKVYPIILIFVLISSFVLAEDEVGSPTTPATPPPPNITIQDIPADPLAGAAVPAPTFDFTPPPAPTPTNTTVPETTTPTPALLENTTTQTTPAANPIQTTTPITPAASNTTTQIQTAQTTQNDAVQQTQSTTSTPAGSNDIIYKNTTNQDSDDESDKLSENKDNSGLNANAQLDQTTESNRNIRKPGMTDFITVGIFFMLFVYIIFKYVRRKSNLS